ncbi:plasmid mobilization protein [Azospirillum endophyticum]
MAATARLVVQMTPEEKRRLERRAKSAGVSTAEFVRRRITDDDLAEHREEIEGLLDALSAAEPGILARLDAALAETEALTAALRERRIP